MTTDVPLRSSNWSEYCECDLASESTLRCHCIIEYTYFPCRPQHDEEPSLGLEPLDHKSPAVWTTYECHFTPAEQTAARRPCPDALWQAMRPPAEVAKHNPALDVEVSGYCCTPECCRAGFARDDAAIEEELVRTASTISASQDLRTKMEAEESIMNLQNEREVIASYHGRCNQNREEYLRQPGIVHWMSGEHTRI